MKSVAGKLAAIDARQLYAAAVLGQLGPEVEAAVQRIPMAGIGTWTRTADLLRAASEDPIVVGPCLFGLVEVVEG